MIPRIETLAMAVADTEYVLNLGNVKKFMFKLRNAAVAYRYSYRPGIVAVPSKVCVFNIANPGTFTWAAHGLAAGQQVILTATGGALPTGITASISYYIKAIVDANTFTISATLGGAAIQFTDTNSCTVKLGNYMEMPAGSSYSDNFASENGSQIAIYFASGTAAQILDVEAW